MSSRTDFSPERRQAITALAAKGAAADADAYRSMLTGIGAEVANAATEGDA